MHTGMSIPDLFDAGTGPPGRRSRPPGPPRRVCEAGTRCPGWTSVGYQASSAPTRSPACCWGSAPWWPWGGGTDAIPGSQRNPTIAAPVWSVGAEETEAGQYSGVEDRSHVSLKGLSYPSLFKVVFHTEVACQKIQHFHWPCWLLFSQKHRVTCKKSTRKVLINFCFVTSFEDSHYTLLFDTFMAHELYSGFAIQNTSMSTVVLINEVSEVLQRHYLPSAIPLTSLSIFAQLPTLRSNIFSTEALLAFWVIPYWFYKFCRQNGYLNSKLMLRWDSPFKSHHIEMAAVQVVTKLRCSQSFRRPWLCGILWVVLVLWLWGAAIQTL